MEALEICATKATRQIERRERADNADGYRRRGRAGGVACGSVKDTVTVKRPSVSVRS